MTLLSFFPQQTLTGLPCVAIGISQLCLCPGRNHVARIVEHLLVRLLEPRDRILHPIVDRMVDADYFISRRVPHLLSLRNVVIQELLAQAPEGKLPVLMLAPGFTAFHHEAALNVRDANPSIGLIAMLPTRTGIPIGLDAKVLSFGVEYQLFSHTLERD
jgi:hypothetical protein